MAKEAVSRDEFPFYYKKLLHQVFHTAAVIPSIQRGLINKDGITLSGDGTCVHTHASPYGHKVCGCADNGEIHCGCPRHYSDPDAHWGWDSGLGAYYFGYTLYMLSYHNGQLGVALKEFRGLCTDISTQNLCFDYANDNYPTYSPCKTWNIRPFIARDTREYKKIYINRTSCERVNNRILNDYHLYSMGIHRRKRYTLFAVIAGINIHADAWMKKQSRGFAGRMTSAQFQLDN